MNDIALCDTHRCVLNVQNPCTAAGYRTPAAESGNGSCKVDDYWKITRYVIYLTNEARGLSVREIMKSDLGESSCMFVSCIVLNYVGSCPVLRAFRYVLHRGPANRTWWESSRTNCRGLCPSNLYFPLEWSYLINSNWLHNCTEIDEQ